jgi:hypothetical protein
MHGVSRQLAPSKAIGGTLISAFQFLAIRSPGPVSEARPLTYAVPEPNREPPPVAGRQPARQVALASGPASTPYRANGPTGCWLHELPSAPASCASKHSTISSTTAACSCAVTNQVAHPLQQVRTQCKPSSDTGTAGAFRLGSQSAFMHDGAGRRLQPQSGCVRRNCAGLISRPSGDSRLINHSRV